MARKYDFISELYNRTCKTVVASPASWEAFLRSACYNYRLRFDEQLERGFAEELKSKWEAQANGKPQKQKDELQTINRRLNELDRLIGSLYENFISGLLPEKQYKSLMKKYSAEQDSLESQVSEIQEKLEQTKASSAHIGRFIRLIKKYKQPTELTKEMACELIDKIVVHEAVDKKPNRQQQVDICYNFIGQFDLPLSEKEIAEARQKAEQEAAEKAKRKKNRQRESNVATIEVQYLDPDTMPDTEVSKTTYELLSDEDFNSETNNNTTTKLRR